MKVDEWDTSSIPLNRRKYLAGIVRNNINIYLQRLKPLRRYTLWICFLWETLLDTTDSVLSLYNDFWLGAFNDAKKKLEFRQLAIVKSQAKSVQTIVRTTEIIVDDSIENQDLRRIIFENIPREKIQEALDIVSN